jgi:hypothetical protein
LQTRSPKLTDRSCQKALKRTLRSARTRQPMASPTLARPMRSVDFACMVNHPFPGQSSGDRPAEKRPSRGTLAP